MNVRNSVLAAAGAALLFLSGCGSKATTRESEVAQGQEVAATDVYFLNADRSAVVAVRRMIPRAGPRPRETLNALLGGPIDNEAREGMKSALPPNTRLLGLRIENGTAVVDLAGLPAKANGPERVRIITQVTRTLVGVNDIQRVRLHSGGRPWGLWQMSGGIADVAYDENDLRGFERVCAGVPGTETVEHDCFSATA